MSDRQQHKRLTRRRRPRPAADDPLTRLLRGAAALPPGPVRDWLMRMVEAEGSCGTTRPPAAKATK
jgi:hypothetical protein